MNATVTLPIGDLDKLRNDLKEAEEKVKFLEKHQKEVKLLVKESHFSNEYVRGSYYNPSYYKTVEKWVAQEPQYIGFEEVKAELKKEAESRVIEEIGKLNREIISLKEKIQTKETENNKKCSELETFYKDKIVEKEEEAKKVAEDFKKEISILKGELVDLGKDEQIKQLTERLNKLEKRNFLERLFNL